MAETGLTKNRILAELSKSTHGALKEYISLGQEAVRREPEFMAHLVAWNRLNGQVRDSQVALPVVSLSITSHADFMDNALAHIAMLGPRELLKAYRFALEIRLPGQMRVMRRLVEAYLREREPNWPKFERMAIQHRRTLKELYALTHIKPSAPAEAILFKGEYPKGSLFDVVARLKDMSPLEAAGEIITRKLPFLIAMGALGAKAKDKDLVLALIGRMSPTELVTNTKMLEKLGMKNDPALRGAYDKALAKVSGSKANILKTSRAVESIEDEDLKEKLRGAQERQIQKMAGVDGNWLVLGDMSGSMAKAIEIATQVSGTLAKMVKGSVHLVFFNTSPRAMDVTGLALDAIMAKTKHISAGGGTSIGCGLQWILENKIEVDGIAVVSDGGENQSPRFPDVYKRYTEFVGKEVPVYLYHCDGDSPDFIHAMERAHYDMQVFDMTHGKVDYYSLPNTVATMRTNRYSLIDEVMETPLLKLNDVLKLQGREVKAVSA